MVKMVTIMTESYKFILPISVTLPRKRVANKKIMLNLNIYRNLHFQVNNQIKELFKPIELSEFKAEKISISYVLEKTSKRKFDTMNIISIVDKFFLDWLVENEYIPDDTCENVTYNHISSLNNSTKNRVIAIVRIIK